MKNEILEELNELQHLHKYEEIHKRRIFEKKLEKWNKHHEDCERLREERRVEFQNKAKENSLQFKGKNYLTFSNDMIEKSSQDDLLTQEQKDEKGKKEIWMDDVFEEPMPQAPEEKVFKEDAMKMEIKKVFLYTSEIRK